MTGSALIAPGAITSGPVALAALRASGTLPVTAVDERATSEARRGADLTGRRLVRLTATAQPVFALGWQPGAVPTLEDGLHGEFEHLRPTALRTLLFCLALGWTDRSAHPWPGETFTLDALVALSNEAGFSATWARAAVQHTLVPAGLVEVSGQTVRLGPAIATLPDTFVDALRRVHERLPRSGDITAAPLRLDASEEDDL